MAAADHLQVPRQHGLFLHHGIDLGDGTIAHYLEGKEILSFGKYKGVTLEEIWNENPGYFSWINQADFPLYTKNMMRNFADKMKLQNKFNS